MPQKSYRTTFFNASFGNILSRVSYYSSFAFLLTQKPSDITDHPGFDIRKMCEWIDDDVSDILMISEVPDGAPLWEVKDMLKARGYGTDSIETLDLWSQTPDYHICQIVAFKTVPERIRQQAFYKIYSPIYALFFAFVATLWASNFSVGKKVYKKLRMGVRDGSLSMLEYPDHIVFLGHLHHWDKQTESFVASFTSETEKSIIIMGDINLDNSQKLLRRSFFRTDTLAWQDLFGHMGRTFGFEGLYYPLWMRWLMYTSPDMAVGRWVTLESAGNIVSLSDHNRIVIEYTILPPQNSPKE